MTVELTTHLDDDLVAHLHAEAQRAGVDLDTHLGRVLAADYRAAHGSREERAARARALAAAAVHEWNGAGRPEGGGVDFEDVFGR
ncbi:hypothetical protein [Kitasatospora phosalacinea]|uniref:Uncharacterized protein n=1 Tax=Kitasatospora phosalacinea TaxID=2065 RepID=A0A9W6PH09_9ACTN|nr:hypothetical protein [Kitasatospora phosalacinea]GLW54707.1 hypothetical protein Kpho01_27180 [Kitasatospora phosalacinea]